MKHDVTHINLMLAWLWLLLGFLSGMVLGMFFRGERWLGGYASFKRRMYRLGHISFFGLGTVNLLFCLTVEHFDLTGTLVSCASWAFVIGALTMPLCCAVLAGKPQAHPIFAVPVVSLIVGGVLMLAMILHEPQTAVAANMPSILLNGQPSTPTLP